jgi:hypothetical protein
MWIGGTKLAWHSLVDRNLCQFLLTTKSSLSSEPEFWGPRIYLGPLLAEIPIREIPQDHSTSEQDSVLYHESRESQKLEKLVNIHRKELVED